VAAYQQKKVVEVAEDVARQVAALLQSQSVDIATVESMVGPILGPYRAAVDLVASADDATMAEAYLVGMVVPQEYHVEEVGASDDIEALFDDSSAGDVVAPATTDEQVALMASFETAHREESTRQFMVAEQEALVAMLVVRANAAREAARVAAEEATARVAARVTGAAVEEEAAHEAARAVELAEEAAAQEEMERDCHRWDDDMATARRAREVHELATQRRHCRNLARCQAHRAR
jgi:nicotinamide mononucleotide (NMN) deamidase PncC